MFERFENVNVTSKVNIKCKCTKSARINLSYTDPDRSQHTFAKQLNRIGYASLSATDTYLNTMQNITFQKKKKKQRDKYL